MSVEKEECELEQLVSSDEEPRPTDNVNTTPPITPKPPPRAHSHTDCRTKTSSGSNKVSGQYFINTFLILIFIYFLFIFKCSHLQLKVKRTNRINLLPNYQVLHQYIKINHMHNYQVQLF